MTRLAVVQAREQLVVQVLRRISAEYSPADDPHRCDEQIYGWELIALAARDLVRAVDALPVEERPVGWEETS